MLTDVQMPVMDGWNLVRILRSRDTTKRVPIVFLSSLAGEKERIKAYEMGVADFLAKPLAPAALVSRLVQIMARANGARGPKTTRRGRRR